MLYHSIMPESPGQDSDTDTQSCCMQTEALSNHNLPLCHACQALSAFRHQYATLLFVQAEAHSNGATFDVTTPFSSH